MKQRLVCMMTTHPRGVDVGLLLLRLWFGLVMAFGHGLPKFDKLDMMGGMLAAKGFPAPEVMAILAALAETVGGLFIAIGLLARPSAITVAFTMVIAAFVIHADDPFAKQEFALAYGAAFVALVLTGPGRLSVDALLAKKLGGPPA